MRLLIAGGAGYVGSALIPRLLARGYMVDVVDLFWFGNYLPLEAGIVSKDLFEVTPEDLKEYDQVIFLAGLSNDPMAEYSPSKNFIYNAAAPAYLAYTAKKAGVKRYIYASSCSVYGYTVNELYDEGRTVSSSYPYGISKLQGEQAVMNLVDDDFFFHREIGLVQFRIHHIAQQLHGFVQIFPQHAGIIHRRFVRGKGVKLGPNFIKGQRNLLPVQTLGSLEYHML